MGVQLDVHAFKLEHLLFAASINVDGDVMVVENAMDSFIILRMYESASQHSNGLWRAIRGNLARGGWLLPLPSVSTWLAQNLSRAFCDGKVTTNWLVCFLKAG